MASVEDIIDKFKRERVSFAEDWRANYTEAYVEAYWRAFDTFNIVKAAQDRKDKALLQFKIDLAIAALTLCGGSVLAAVMGAMTFKQAAGQVAMNALCKANMHDIFTKAKLTLENKVLEFAVGKAGAEIQMIATSEAKKIFTNEYIGASVKQSWIEKPHTKQYIMTQFILRNRRQLREACNTLAKSPISAQKKEALFNAIKQSHFCNPPKQNVIKDIAKYAELIELTFYLKMILDSDYLAHQIRVFNDLPRDQWVTLRKDAISQIPGQTNYPKDSFKRGGLIQHAEQTIVKYREIGQEYIDRMNYLFSTHIPGQQKSKLIESRMLGERTSKPILIRAYNTLKIMGNMNKNLIFNPNGGIKMQP